jgi:DNA-3-methyladenine glycosylase II
MSHSPDYWSIACDTLSSRDPILAGFIESYLGSVVRDRGNAFETLLRAIVGQQISVKAADSVWNKVLLRTDSPITPEVFATLDETTLRGCGLSGQKVKYMQGITKAFQEGWLHPHRWHNMGDDAILAELVQLPGIGDWTAHMFLIFHLLRPNVLPLGDIGLLNAFDKAYQPQGLKGLKGAARYKKLAQSVQRHANRYWHPYNTVAVWFLWRSLDPHEVQY